MILADKTIKKLIQNKSLGIEPFNKKLVQPASLDCRLGNDFLIADNSKMKNITLNSEILYRRVTSSSITIDPLSFLLATTLEYIRLPNNLTAFVEGRSSIGRIGLFIQNAGWVDPGFEGCITLELYNANSLPIKLEAGRRICQLVFCKMDEESEYPYNGKYQGQKTTVGSRILEDKEVAHNKI